jgi:hypothetical protein
MGTIKVVGLGLNTEENKYMFMSYGPNAGKNNNTNRAVNPSKCGTVEVFCDNTTKQNCVRKEIKIR